MILAGGFGTRISEESHLRPKPMVEINGAPILWHIMKFYSFYGYTDFIICCGYKGDMIKEYFANYYLHRSDITFDFSQENRMIVHTNIVEPWKVTLIDTGLHTMTGGRIKRVEPYIRGENFMLTYGDGLCNLDLRELEKFHRSHEGVATLTAVQPGGRFGALDIKGKTVCSFQEKTRDGGGWINGGYMVLHRKIFDYIQGDETVFEKEPLESLASKGELYAYRHEGFWQCMDTLRDKELLEKLLIEKRAPWVVWRK